MPRRFATAALLAAAFLAGPVYAQPAADATASPVPPLLPADHPFAEPVLDSAARLTAQRASVFDDDGAQVLLLEGDVTIELGVYAFTARRAVVRIDARRDGPPPVDLPRRRPDPRRDQRDPRLGQPPAGDRLDPRGV